VRRLAVHRCARCGESNLTKFYKASDRPSGLRGWCKNCSFTAQVASERRRGIYGIRAKVWRAKKIVEDPNRRALEVERSVAWQKRNPESVRMNHHRRRARKVAAAGGGVTAAQWAGIVLVFGGVCSYCRQAKKITVDHFVPLIRGGKHDVSNVVPACRSCNASKKDRDPFEWMGLRGIDGDFVVANLCETRHCAAAAA
jgi:5-methylcytosine-specific restriction endonuclease McrA